MHGRHGHGAELDCQKKKTNLVAIYVLLFFVAIIITFDQSYAANVLWDIFLNFLPNVRLDDGI